MLKLKGRFKLGTPPIELPWYEADSLDDLPRAHREGEWIAIDIDNETFTFFVIDGQWTKVQQLEEHICNCPGCPSKREERRFYSEGGYE